MKATAASSAAARASSRGLMTSLVHPPPRNAASMARRTPVSNLPTWLWPATGLIAVLLTVAAASGLLLDAYQMETQFARRGYQGSDLVSFVVAIPLLTGGAWLARRGSTRGLLLWLGGLGYVAYQYAYTFAYGWNRLFLVYLTLLSLSAFALATALVRVDAARVAATADAEAPITCVAWFVTLIGIALAALELGQIVPTIFTGDTPQIVQDTAHPTSPVYVLDVGFVIPLLLLTGYWLRHHNPWGHVSAAIVLVKGITVGAGLLAANVLTVVGGGTTTDGPLNVLWAAIAGGSAAALTQFLRHLHDRPADGLRPTGRHHRADRRRVKLRDAIFGFRSFERFVKHLERLDLPTGPVDARLVTEADLESLPEPARRYMRFMNVIGRPRDWSFRARLVGGMRMAPDKPWMPCTAWQYNTSLGVARVFDLRIDFARVIPMYGSDTYVEGRGRMLGKVANVVKVADGSGREFDLGELVTYLNDVCLLAPSMLLNDAVSFSDVDDASFDVTLVDRDNSVTARVFVAEDGSVVDFSTEDRWYSSSDGLVHARWTTPVSGWIRGSGRSLPSGAAAIWHLDSGQFEYAWARFEPDALEFNVPPVLREPR